MRRHLPMLATAALLVGACSGGSDDTADSTIAPPETVAATPDTSTPPTEAPTTTDTTTTSLPPTTTIDQAAVLAEAEAAYLEAFEVGQQVLRDPDNPDNEALLRAHFVGSNLDGALEDLRLTIDGNFVAAENESNPSFSNVMTPAEFVEGEPGIVRMTVCEFNSDRILERGTAPDGGDSLVRDDPVSILITVRMQLIDGKWKALSGTRGEEIRDEVERCSVAS